MEVTKEKIQEWKKQYGDVFEFNSVTDKDGNKIVDNKGKVKAGEKQMSCWLRRPTLQILDAAKVGAGNSQLKFNEILLRNCWIEGDKEILEEDVYKAGVFDLLHLLMAQVDFELKKL